MRHPLCEISVFATATMYGVLSCLVDLDVITAGVPNEKTKT